jgi:hypothetical protein
MDGSGGLSEWMYSALASIIGIAGGGASAIGLMRERLRAGEERLRNADAAIQKLQDERDKCKERHDRDTECIYHRLNELSQKGHDLETKIYQELANIRVEIKGIAVALAAKTETTWIDRTPLQPPPMSKPPWQP